MPGCVYSGVWLLQISSKYQQITLIDIFGFWYILLLCSIFILMAQNSRHDNVINQNLIWIKSSFKTKNQQN